jgi:hypothetical protein
VSRKIISILLMFICFSLTPQVFAAEGHWAAQDLITLNELYQLEIMGELDEPADQAFQEKVFTLIGLKKRPRTEMLRFRIFYELVKALDVEIASDEDCEQLLNEFTDKCTYCKKNNRILGTAKEIGLLRGRKTPTGLVLAIDQPVTKAELAVLALRYLKIIEEG